MYKIYLAKFYNENEDFYKVWFSHLSEFDEHIKSIPYECEILKKVTVKTEYDTWLIMRSVLCDFYKNFFIYTPKISFKRNHVGLFIGNCEFMETQFNVSIKKYLHEDRNKVMHSNAIDNVVLQLARRLRKENMPEKPRRTKVKKRSDINNKSKAKNNLKIL